MTTRSLTCRWLRTTGASFLLISSRQYGVAPASSLSSNSSARPRLGFPYDLTDRMILAPLTRGGNLPYRRLCADFGCEISLSEMIYARSLLGGDAVERARLRRAANEKCFGVQIATNDVEEGVAAMELIKKAGTADFIDLNCGCPIYEATRRGLGSSLLRSPKKLGRLAGGMVEGFGGIPLTVKIRLGCEDSTINVHEVVTSLRDAGVSAITIHGRTAQNRYSKPNNWEMIRDVVKNNSGMGSDLRVPIIGNGDILTHYEAKMRMEQSGVDALMVGRGALTKPWIFKEFKDDAEYQPDVKERIAIYRTLSLYMKDHFGDDAKGKKKSFLFLPWHFEFLCRYQPLPEDEFKAISRVTPLIQRRYFPSDADMSPLELLLSCRNKKAHESIAERLWESSSEKEAFDLLAAFAESHEFKLIQANATEASAETEELANIPRNGKDDRRRGRNPKPKRTPEEIRLIRAERAEKKAARLAAEAGVQGGKEEGGSAPLGPLRDQPGVIKRWITSRRMGQFGFIGIEGIKEEYIAFEDSIGKDILPISEDSLPISVYFDTEVAEDASESDRAVNVRLA